jgi:hypothetical protein
MKNYQVEINNGIFTIEACSMKSAIRKAISAEFEDRNPDPSSEYLEIRAERL